MQKCIQKVIHKLCFFAILSWFWGSGGLPEAASKRGPKKTSKDQIPQSVLGSYFGTLFAQNRIRNHFCGVYFYACFWHCFWRASGTNLIRFSVILRSNLLSLCVFVGVVAKLQKCNTSETKTLFLGMLGLHLHIIFISFSKFFLCCSQDSIFVRFLQIWASKGVPCQTNCRSFCRLHEKKSVEIEAWKLTHFGL